MTELTPKQVAHLAHLARIALTDAEIAHLTTELQEIVGAVEKVREVVTPDIPGTSHPIPLQNVSRPDVVADQLSQEEALSGAPESAEHRFVVSAILGEEQ